MEQTFDFSVEETAKVSVLLEELGEMICQKERWPHANAEKLLLCNMQTDQIIPAEATLAGAGVTSGGHLMLV